MTVPRPLPLPQSPQQKPLTVHDARDLTQGQTTALIVLDGQTYVLRITKAGKLILTK